MKKIFSFLCLIVFLFLFSNKVNGSNESSKVLQSYKDIYIITGGGEAGTKMQFSFKYDILYPYDLFSLDFFFGYNQLTFCNNHGSTIYFSDINFNPEFFLERKFKKYIDLLRVGLYEHKSNNKDFQNSRSWDRGYIEAERTMKIGFNYVKVNTKLFKMYHVSERNEDINDYMGYYETKIAMKRSKIIRDQFYIKFGSNYNLKKGWREVGLIIDTYFFNWNPLIFVQIWHGYGEKLIDYNKKEIVIRAGVILNK